MGKVLKVFLCVVYYPVNNYTTYMESEIIKKLEEQSRKLEVIEQSVRKIRSYLLWTFMISLVVFILPLIGLAIMVPRLLNIYSSLGSL